VFPLRRAGQPDVGPQRVDEHADLGVDLLGKDALEDEPEARPHLRGHHREVADLLLGSAAEALHPVGADYLRCPGRQEERGGTEPLHTFA